jgi:hypothetical protein
MSSLPIGAAVLNELQLLLNRVEFELIGILFALAARLDQFELLLAQSVES